MRGIETISERTTSAMVKYMKPRHGSATLKHRVAKLDYINTVQVALPWGTTCAWRMLHNINPCTCLRRTLMTSPGGDIFKIFYMGKLFKNGKILTNKFTMFIPVCLL